MLASKYLGLLVFLIYVVFCLSTKHNVMVVLGSADERILRERISAAIQFIQSSDDAIILFISGGVKNAIVNTDEMSEASKAAQLLDQQSFDRIQIVLDEYATNTAENFAYLKRWVNNNFSRDELPDFVITTSDFHQTRAERIFHGILPDIIPKWNLSKSSCVQCWSDEAIHMRNVHTDIMKAKLIM